MRVSEAAERLGVTPRTIKYYEELGLLCPSRSSGNYRAYDAEDLDRIDRIRNMQKLGFSLAAIREVLKYRAQVDASGQRRLRLADLEAVTGALEQQLAEVRAGLARARAEIVEGEKLAAELEADVARCRARLAERKGSRDAVRATA